MTEVVTSVAEIQARQDVPARTNTVVTQENMHQWVDEQLKPAGEDGPVGGNGADTINPDPEKQAAEEFAKLPKVEPKEGDVDGAKAFFRGKWVPKHDFDYRLHLKTEERTKELQDARKTAETAAKEASDRALAAERERNDLRLKYEQPKQDELGPEPQPEQFKEPREFAKALKDWTADAVRREETAKVQHQTKVNAWNEAMTKAKKEIPTYDEDIKAAETMLVGAELKDAIQDSEFGPHILHHLAKNPAFLDSLHKLSVPAMIRAVGRLEATFGQPKPAAVEVAQDKPKTPVAEISSAPAPITPIRGGAGVVSLKGSDEVPRNWTYEQWKAERQAGRIK